MLDPVIDSLLVGAGLFYRALWPILLGVFLTALIETLVDRDRMAALLGGRDPASVGRASVFGAASSACTFGALSLTQSLFKKGASAEASFAFGFASTNLVFELGILIYALLGWQFLAAELLGGVLLIAVVYLIARATLPERLFAEARERLRQAHPEEPGPERFSRSVAATGGWRTHLTSREGWRRIARNYFHTLQRIYKSAVFGFLVAGFIVELVPTAFWRALFLPPDSFLGVAENAALGVTAGVISFIGSIGNVPFAAALWVSGVSFAGVIACIYADLITVPVMNLWRRFFGRAAAAYIFVIFFVTMTFSAVVMEYLFRALGWIPERITGASYAAFLEVDVDATLVLTIGMLVLSAMLWRLQRGPGPRSGGARRSAG